MNRDVCRLDEIKIADDWVAPSLQHRIHDLVSGSIWQYGWRSNVDRAGGMFWHAHFAGGDDTTRVDCSNELERRGTECPIRQLWEVLSTRLGADYAPIRAYANAHTFGVEGTLHSDSNVASDLSVVYYAHRRWEADWAGETLFFPGGVDTNVRAVVPAPGRLALFHGVIPHVARGTSRSCEELRVTVVFKLVKRESPEHAD